MKLFAIPINLNDMPNSTGIILSVNGELYRVYRRDFKHNMVWVRPYLGVDSIEKKV